MTELERLVALETYAEMLAVLKPKQLAVVALRLDGLSGAQIAELLGMTRAAVSRRFVLAQERLIERWPELEAEQAQRSLHRGIRFQARDTVLRGMPRGQALILGVMADMEDEGLMVTPTTIARRMGRERRDVSSRLPDLVAAGYVARLEKVGRNVQPYKVTGVGRAALAKARAVLP